MESTRMHDNSPLTGIIISAVIASMAAIPLPFEPAHLDPTLLWFLKGVAGIVIFESLRRAFVILILDKFFPDRAAAARLTWWQRWREKQQQKRMKE